MEVGLRKQEMDSLERVLDLRENLATECFRGAIRCIVTIVICRALLGGSWRVCLEILTEANVATAGGPVRNRDEVLVLLYR